MALVVQSDRFQESLMENVGPGSYNIKGNITENKDNAAAFNSKEQRMFENKYAKINNPGPGTYNINNPYNDTVNNFFIILGTQCIDRK